jgi:WD40 repeat protein
VTAVAKPVVLRGHCGKVNGLAFTREGLLLSCGQDRTARVWDVSKKKPRHVLTGHKGDVRAAVQVGAAFVTISDDCGVRFFRVKKSGAITCTLCKGHTSGVRALAASPSRTRVATASDDGTVRVWTAEGKPLATIRGHAYGATGAELESDDVVITTAARGERRAFDAKTGKAIARKLAPQPPVPMPDGITCAGPVNDEYLYVARKDGSVVVAEPQTNPACVLAGHDDAVLAVAVSHDGELIATGAADGVIHVWKWRDAQSPLAPRTMDVMTAVDKLWSRAITEGPDTRFHGDALLVGLNQGLFAHDPKTGEPRWSIDQKDEIVWVGKDTVCFAHYDESATLFDLASKKSVLTVMLEGNYLRRHEAPKNGPMMWVTQRENRPNDLMLFDVDARTLSSCGPMNGAGDSFRARADGRAAIVLGEGPSAWVWDTEKKRLAGELRWTGESALDADFSHDAKRVVVGTRDGHVYVFDATTCAFERELVAPKGPEHQGWAPIHVSPATDRAVVFGGDNLHAELFEISTGRFLGRVFPKEKSGWISEGRAFTPDGTILVAGHASKPKIVFVDAISGAVIEETAGHRNGGISMSIFFVRDGERVVTCSRSADDRSLRCWDPKTGARLWTNLAAGGSQIKDVIFSHDERLAAITAQDWDHVLVLDVGSGDTVALLPGHPEYARAPSFSADGSLLATSSNDKIVQMWRIRG